MGFGGFGESGMGSYHGIDGFRTFSHYKSIVDKKTWIDLPMRYQKYRKIYEKWYGCLCGRYEGRALPDASPSCYFRFSYYFSQMIFTGMIPVSSLLFSSGWLQPA